MINIYLNCVTTNLGLGIKKLALAFFGCTKSLDQIDFEAFILLALTILTLSTLPPSLLISLMALLYSVEGILIVLPSFVDMNLMILSSPIATSPVEKSSPIVI